MAETHIPQFDLIEYGFLLPNGEIIWDFWGPGDEVARRVVTERGTVDNDKLLAVRDRYTAHLIKHVGLTRAQINNMAPVMVVTRTRKQYYTDTVEV